MEYNLFGRQVFIVGTVFPKLPVVWGAQGPREPSGWMPALYFVIAELPYICSKLPPCPPPGSLPQGCPSSQKCPLFKVTSDTAWIVGGDGNF